MDWTNWPYITVGLVCRGFSDRDIRKIIGENFLRYAGRVLDKQPWGPFV
jgi:microsomal dipeptidase-like Zn-dependent dipeptidase